MLYYLFNFLDKNYQVPGAGLFEFISFRSAMAIILSLAISTIYGKKIINYLQKKQIGESVRDLGLKRSECKGWYSNNGRIDHHNSHFNSGVIIC